MASIFPKKFPASPQTEFPLAMVAALKKSDSRDIDIQIAYTRLHSTLLDYVLYQAVPPVINKWSVSLVEDAIQNHGLNKSAFELDRIIQCLNQQMWDTFLDEPVYKDIIVESIALMPNDHEWLRKSYVYSVNATLAYTLRALTEHLLQENGGVQIQNGVLHSVQSRGSKDPSKILLERWVSRIGSLKPASTHVKTSDTKTSDTEVW